MPRIESTSTTTSAAENSTATGCRIFSTELLASSTAMIRMANATNRPEKYSIRAWPKGCSSSAGLAAIRKPSSMMIELEASERLLIASAVMDTEAESRPIVSFAANSSRLQRMPTTPVSFP